MSLLLSEKQKIVWQNTIQDFHRWNISYGATRSGKTYLDYYKIPARIRRADESGLIALLGNTQATLERNLLEPMRGLWGPGLVGNINSKNEIILFGRKAYAIGADKISQVARIQGAGFSYVYGDEITTWSKEVFDMLKSRLDKATSCFDGTCNPDAPTHWFKEFLDQPDLDIYSMGFTIDDNPFLDPRFVAELKKEYAGTVLYGRFIDGKWVAAEGVIYKHFADNPDRYIIDELPDGLAYGVIGVDFGGNKSGHAFNFTAFNASMTEIVTVRDFYRRGIITPETLYDDFITFVLLCQSLKIRIIDIRADSAEPVLIAGMQQALTKAGLPYGISNAIKGKIIDRIRLYTILLGTDRWKIHKSCEKTIEAFRTAVFDSKSLEDKRLDNGTTLIDPIDAQEYTTEPYQEALIYGG